MKVKKQEKSLKKPESPLKDPKAKLSGQKVKTQNFLFSSYISRVKKQIHPNLGISKSSMHILESFIIDFFERICKESSQLMSINSSKTLRSQDIIAAINLVLPGELGKHAKLEAEKAMKTFTPTN